MLIKGSKITLPQISVHCNTVGMLSVIAEIYATLGNNQKTVGTPHDVLTSREIGKSYQLIESNH